MRKTSAAEFFRPSSAADEDDQKVFSPDFYASSTVHLELAAMYDRMSAGGKCSRPYSVRSKIE